MWKGWEEYQNTETLSYVVMEIHVLLWNSSLKLLPTSLLPYNEQLHQSKSIKVHCYTPHRGAHHIVLSICFKTAAPFFRFVFTFVRMCEVVHWQENRYIGRTLYNPL